MKRLFRFLTAVFKYILFGKVLENGDVQKRLNICKSCEYYQKDKDKCKICGCYIRAKSIMSTEICPENKW